MGRGIFFLCPVIWSWESLELRSWATRTLGLLISLTCCVTLNSLLTISDFLPLETEVCDSYKQGLYVLVSQGPSMERLSVHCG